MEHNYSTITQIHNVNIDMQYADDISKISSDYNNIQRFKHDIPEL